MKIDQRDADAALGGEVHAHSSWILPLLLLVIAAAIAGGFFIFLAGPTVEDIQGNTPWPTASADTADIRIDGVLYRIPANYTKFRRSRSDGDQDDVPMHALLPNMSPWSPGDAKAFASNAPDAKVIQFTLALDRAPLTYQQKFERGIKPRADNQEGEAGPFGLTQYQVQPRHRLREHGVVHGDAGRRLRTRHALRRVAEHRLRLKLHARHAPARQCGSDLQVQARPSGAMETDRRRHHGPDRVVPARNRSYGFFDNRRRGRQIHLQDRHLEMIGRLAVFGVFEDHADELVADH